MNLGTNVYKAVVSMTCIYRATVRSESHGLGLERPEEVEGHDDEYEAYRKRMMLAYRFRPNPLVNIFFT
jgi:hypothetical protein